MHTTIFRCSYPGAWWSRHIGRTVRILFTDQYGYWTRDTYREGASGWAGYPFLQWVDRADTSPTFGGAN